MRAHPDESLAFTKLKEVFLYAYERANSLTAEVPLPTFNITVEEELLPSPELETLKVALRAVQEAMEPVIDKAADVISLSEH
jgi:hypothetical protein